jgi:hypothetical protein
MILNRIDSMAKPPEIYTWTKISFPSLKTTFQ